VKIKFWRGRAERDQGEQDRDPLERLNGEIKRRSEAVARLIGALLLEHNDGRAVQRARCMSMETIALLSDSDDDSPPALVG
jgi:putative transposase